MYNQAGSKCKCLQIRSMPSSSASINTFVLIWSELLSDCAHPICHEQYCLPSQIMDEIQGGLRYLMQTDSKYTLMVSGTGHAGMEACVSNLVEPGDKVGVSRIWHAALNSWQAGDAAMQAAGPCVPCALQTGQSSMVVTSRTPAVVACSDRIARGRRETPAHRPHVTALMGGRVWEIKHHVD